MPLKKNPNTLAGIRSHGWRPAYEAVVVTGRHDEKEVHILLGASAAPATLRPLNLTRPASQARLSAFVERNLEIIGKLALSKIEAGEAKRVRPTAARTSQTLTLTLTSEDFASTTAE